MSDRLMRKQSWSMILVPTFLLVGCEINSNNTKVQYMPDMADAPTFKAQENYLEPPEHSVPVTGVLYPATVEESEKQLQNPFPASEAVIADGQKLYNNYCVVCHGADAKGEHALGQAFPRPPDITIAQYKDRKDGFYFHRITFGSAIMPSYGHATSPNERWKIVHYLRTLQK